MLSSEDKILIKTCGNLKDFQPEDSSRNSRTKIKKMSSGRLFVKVANIAEQPVRSNALQEAISSVSHLELQITLPQLKTQLSLR